MQVFINTIDAKGRIVLPTEHLAYLGLQPSDEVQIRLRGEEIAIRSAKLSCIFCGDEQAELVLEKRGYSICKHCALEVAEKIRPEAE